MALTSGAVSLTSATASSIVIAGAVATGGTGTYTYQWYRSTDLGSTWTAIGGATTAASVTDSSVSSGQMYAYKLQSLDTAASPNVFTDSAIVGPVLAWNTPSASATYGASATALAPVATPTDIINIFGSASKTVSITKIVVSGITTAATAITMDLRVAKRSTAGTLGSAVLTALTAVPFDSNLPAAAATVSTVGTANYTTLGTLTGIVAASTLPLGLSPATATDFPMSKEIVFNFADITGNGILLRGATQQLALNLNGATLPAGTVLDITVFWTEF